MFTLGEAIAGFGVYRLSAGIGLPAPDNYIDIERIDLDESSSALCLLGSDKRAARSTKRIKNEITSYGRILDDIGHERHGLDRRVHGQQFIAMLPEAINTAVVPHVGPVSAVDTEVDVVDVGRETAFKHENELVLGAIKRAHTRVGLAPHTDVFKFRVDGVAGGKDFLAMPPIHAKVVKRTVQGVGRQVFHRIGQKRCELIGGHLPGCHREFSMLHAAGTASVATYANIVRRIGEYQPGALTIQQRFIGACGKSVAAVDAVLPGLPQVADAGDGWLAERYADVITGAVGGTLKDDVDFGSFKAKDRKVEIDIQIVKELKFAAQDGRIPSGYLGEPVVSDDESVFFQRAQMSHSNNGHGRHSEPLSGLNSCVTAEEPVVLIYDAGYQKAECVDAFGKFLNLSF